MEEPLPRQTFVKDAAGRIWKDNRYGTWTHDVESRRESDGELVRTQYAAPWNFLEYFLGPLQQVEVEGKDYFVQEAPYPDVTKDGVSKVYPGRAGG